MQDPGVLRVAVLPSLITRTWQSGSHISLGIRSITDARVASAWYAGMKIVVGLGVLAVVAGGAYTVMFEMYKMPSGSMGGPESRGRCRLTTSLIFRIISGDSSENSMPMPEGSRC